MPENNGGFKALKFGKYSEKMYTELSSDHPIDLTRYQVANGYMGRVGLINSGGESKGEGDLAQAVRTAVINKRAGGMGLISGRKAFQRPMAEGAEILNAIQDVYLDPRRDHRVDLFKLSAYFCRGVSWLYAPTDFGLILEPVRVVKSYPQINVE